MGSQVKKCPKIKAFNELSEPIKCDVSKLKTV